MRLLCTMESHIVCLIASFLVMEELNDSKSNTKHHFTHTHTHTHTQMYTHMYTHAHTNAHLSTLVHITKKVVYSEIAYEFKSQHFKAMQPRGNRAYHLCKLGSNTSVNELE
jgi:hypothetical protein